MARITDPNQRMARVQSLYDMAELERNGITYDPVKNAFVFASQPGWTQDASTGVITGPDGQTASRPEFNISRGNNSAIGIPDTAGYRQQQAAFDAVGVPNLPNPFAMRQTRSLGEQFLDVGKAVAPVVGGALLGGGLASVFGGAGATGAGGLGAAFGPAAPAATGIEAIQFPGMAAGGVFGGAAGAGAGTAAGAAAAGSGGLGGILSSVGAGGKLGDILGGIGDFFGNGRGRDIIDLIGSGLSAYGAYDAYRQGRNVSDLQNQTLRNLTTNLGPVAGISPAGGGAFDPATGATMFGSGELDPIRQLLTLYATGTVPGIGQGLPGSVQAATGQGALPGYADSALLQAFGGLSPALENLNTAAGTGFQDVYNRTLANLRAQAQPFETQALNALNENQFATGRSGTSGGALQTEAFARGLGQADLGRQLAATGEARTNLSLSDQLLRSAFGRFGDTSRLFQDINDVGYNRALTNVQLPNALQAGQLNNVGAALQGQGGINTQAINTFLAALNAAGTAGNLRVGAGANAAALAGSPTFGSAALGPAAGLTMLGNAINSDGRSLTEILGRVFRPNDPLAGTTV